MAVKKKKKKEVVLKENHKYLGSDRPIATTATAGEETTARWVPETPPSTPHKCSQTVKKHDNERQKPARTSPMRN